MIFISVIWYEIDFVHLVDEGLKSWNVLVAKRKACLQPEKTQGYQYLFAVQFLNSYVYGMGAGSIRAIKVV